MQFWSNPFHVKYHDIERMTQQVISKLWVSKLLLQLMLQSSAAAEDKTVSQSQQTSFRQHNTHKSPATIANITTT